MGCNATIALWGQVRGLDWSAMSRNSRVLAVSRRVIERGETEFNASCKWPLPRMGRGVGGCGAWGLNIACEIERPWGVKKLPRLFQIKRDLFS